MKGFREGYSITPSIAPYSGADTFKGLVFSDIQSESIMPQENIVEYFIGRLR